MLLVTSVMLALAATPLAGQALAARATDAGEQVGLLRCLLERGFALLTGRWPTLQHITASPSKIGDIARAALVLSHFGHGYIK